MRGRRRYVVIALLVALMAAAVFVGGEILRQAFVGEAETPEVTAEPEVLVRQEGQFGGLGGPPRRPVGLSSGVTGVAGADPSTGAAAAGAATGRTLDAIDELRAYPGAPPSIPHEVEGEMVTGSVCLGCHQNGGWVPKFEAYAPVTPHPELVSCQQCHVARVEETVFRPTSFVRPERPALGQAALPGSPPPMPHGLRMRETCAACHAGPSAAPELRTDHPERVGCLQCHVPQETASDDTWKRGEGR